MTVTGQVRRVRQGEGDRAVYVDVWVLEDGGVDAVRCNGRVDSFAQLPAEGDRVAMLVTVRARDGKYGAYLQTRIIDVMAHEPAKEAAKG